MRDVLRIITPPTDRAVDLDEAKRHLRVEDSDSDGLISAYLQAAEQSLAYVGRAMRPVTYALDVYRWRREIELPMPPLRSVTGISGTQGTLDPSTYSVTTTAEGRGIVRMLGSYSWMPLDYGQVALSIEFTAGYDEVPAALRAAILLTAESLFENRSEASAIPLARMPTGVKALAAPYIDPHL